MTAAASGFFWLNGWGTPLSDDISETFTGTDGAAWGSAWTSQVGSTILSNTGRLVTAATAYTAAQAYRTPSLLDGDLTIRTQFTGTTERYHTVYFRYTNVGNSGYAVMLSHSGFAIKRYDSGAQTTLATTANTITAAWYKIRIQWQGNVIRAKFWLDTDVEPGTWTLTATDDTYGVPGALLLQVLSGATATAITGYYDDLAVHDLNTSPDVTPTQVLGVTATTGPGAATIRWTPQNTADGYKIYRAGTLLATVTDYSYRVWTDATGTVGTSYAYTVSAYNTAGEGPQSASASASRTTYTAWSAWTTARDARATAKASVLYVGDSITEGQGASTKANRWQDIVSANIRTAYPTTGAPGDYYYPAFYAVYAPDSTWQSATTVAPGQWTDVYGALGYRSTIIPVAGASTTFTVFGTAIDIWSGGPGGTMTYQVDGGSVISVNQAAHTAATKTRVTFGGAAASHTVVIDCTAGTALLAGWTVFNGDETVGINFYDSARSGYKTINFVADTAADYTGQIAAWGAVAPDLVILALGINDYSSGYTVDRIKSNIMQIVDSFKKFPKIPNVVLVGMYARFDYTASNGDTWQGFIDALKAVQAADPAVIPAVVDFYADMGTTSAGGYWSSDALHPSDSGHAHMAGVVYAALPSVSAVTGAAAMAGSGSLAITATLSLSSPVAMVGDGTLAAAAAITHPSTVAMAGTGSLTATATGTTAAGVALAGVGTLAAVPALTRLGALVMAGGASLTIAGVSSIAGTETMGGAGGLTVSGVAAHSSAVTLLGTGALVATTQQAVPSSESFAGSGGLSLAPLTVVPGAVAMASIGTLTVTPATVAVGSATLAGTGTLGVTTVITGLTSVAMPGSSTLTIGPTGTQFAPVTMSGSGLLTTVGWTQQSAAPVMTGLGGLLLSDTTTRVASIAIAGVGGLVVSGVRAGTGVAVMSGVGMLAVGSDTYSDEHSDTYGAGPIITHPSVVTLAGAGGLTVAITFTQAGVVAMIGSGGLSAVPSSTAVATAVSAGAGLLSVTATVTSSSSLSMAGDGTLAVVPTVTPLAVMAMLGVGITEVGGGQILPGITPLVGAGLLTVTGTTSPAGSVTMAGTGGLTIFESSGDTYSDTYRDPYPVPSLVAHPAAVTMSGGGMLNLSPALIVGYPVAMTGGGLLVITTTGGPATTATLAGAGGLAVEGATTSVTGVGMTGTGALTVTAIGTAGGVVLMVSTGDLFVSAGAAAVVAVSMTGVSDLVVAGATSAATMIPLNGFGFLAISGGVIRSVAFFIAGVGTLVIYPGSAAGAGLITIGGPTQHVLTVGHPWPTIITIGRPRVRSRV